MTSCSMLGYFSLLESESPGKHGGSQLFNSPLSGMTGVHDNVRITPQSAPLFHAAGRSFSIYRAATPNLRRLHP